MICASIFSISCQRIQLILATTLVGLLLVAPVVSAQYGTFVKVYSPGGYHHGLTFINDSVGYSVAGSVVQMTTDSGRIWIEQAILYPQFSFGQLKAVWADTTGVVIVGASSEFSNTQGPTFRSTNFGATWAQVFLTGVNERYVNAIAWLGGKLIATGNDLRVDTARSFMWVSTNRGLTWLYSNALEQFRGNFARITIIDSLRAFAYGTAGKVAYTSDGGASWVNRYIPNSVAFVYDMSVKRNGNIEAVVVSNTTSTYLTTNSGVTWTLSYSVPQINFFGTTIVENVLGTFVGGGGYQFGSDVRFRKVDTFDFVQVFFDSTAHGGGIITRKWTFPDGRVVYAGAGDFVNYYPPTRPVVLDALGDTVRVRSGEQVNARFKFAQPGVTLAGTAQSGASWLTISKEPLTEDADTLHFLFSGVAAGYTHRDTTYVVRLRVTPSRGDMLVRDVVVLVEGSVSSASTPGTPGRFSLEQNYPNPFNPSTHIAFSIRTSGHTSLRVYDLLGREVAALVDEHKPAGNYRVEWNAENIPSGVYLYRLTGSGFTATRKMLLLR